MFSIKSFSCFSFFKQQRLIFSSKKLIQPRNTVVKPLWQNIHKRLQVFSDELTKIEMHLRQNTEKVDPRTQESLRLRMNDIQPIVALYEKYNHIFKGLEELKAMGNENADKETKQFISDEEANYKQLLADLEEKAIEFLIPKNRFDGCMSINLEIRPGVGGSESALFADDLFSMYQNFVGSQGWRVIRVPETEKYGRLHSSAVSVVVLPEIPMDFKLDEKDLKFDYMRASGAGGQHVNKTDSACRITHIPTGLAVHNMEDRSQEKNRKKALEILTSKLFLIEVEKTNTFLTSQRKEQIAGADRSDKIRTYNFPQSRITDHRTNLTLFGMEKMLNGDFLEEFIDEFCKQSHNEKLRIFFEKLKEEEK